MGSHVEHAWQQPHDETVYSKTVPDCVLQGMSLKATLSYGRVLRHALIGSETISLGVLHRHLSLGHVACLVHGIRYLP